MDTFGSRAALRVGSRSYDFFKLACLEKRGFNLQRLPYCMRVLLENLLRNENGRSVTAAEVEFLAGWDPQAPASREISFSPARVLLQDFTGVPAVVDLGSMRDAMVALGGDPSRINPIQPAELVIDHSVQVDEFGNPNAFHVNVDLEYQRNHERYKFLRWGQSAFRNFKVVPPGMGICHQVNLEYLARVVFPVEREGTWMAYPDTLVGTDSHTTMVNGLGVLGWGVGGIEAEAAMLGQPVSMLLPNVVGFRLKGRLKEGSTATDLVLTVTEMLRRKGVVGKFVEFFGEGLNSLPVADRATISNMSPEYGATCGIFPVDDATLRYLQMTGRSAEHIALVEAYCKEQGLFHGAETAEAGYTDTLELDLSSVEPSISGPKRPQDRVPLSSARESFQHALPGLMHPGATGAKKVALPIVGRWEAEGGHAAAAVAVEAPPEEHADSGFLLDHGHIVIAAITSCTNTSNPSVMLGAGLLAKKAVERGLKPPPWVKTSLAPGSRVVTDYYRQSGLMPYLDQLGFSVVGYGCTTCIGNSGPLPAEVSRQVEENQLVVVSVLSGNRNFEGRINSEVRANYLMSPMLVVAYALAGRMDVDLTHDPLGRGRNGEPVYLRDIWPSQHEIAETIQQAVRSDMFRSNYESIFAGDERWQKLESPAGDTYDWPHSTYIKRAPYFEGMGRQPAPVKEIRGARMLARLGDSITTDHISPAGSIKPASPAGRYLLAHGVQAADFNSYGSRRGNHEVMVRGTFANVRLRNRMVPELEGGFTRHLPSGEQMTIFGAAERYAAEGVPLIIVAGKEYGSGSSRDWAAKGPLLLGVRAVIAQSYERIHRSNLVGMGILPLEFLQEENAESLGLCGDEIFDVTGIAELLADFSRPRRARVRACRNNGAEDDFEVAVRIDTPQEALYYRHGGILQYVLRQLLNG
ncbi:MAG: aconitate hydratase AcnA [Acidobacteria bacterium]|nr:aconitate hydratase AcnA [Acidobacteriota bacterium]